MGDGFDLDAYLHRIGYEGPREPSLLPLSALVAAHSAAIAFENIDVLLQRGISLDIAAIQQKLVQRRRGGYCFEQNTLLEAALGALGFSLVTLVVRVVRGLRESAPTPALTSCCKLICPREPISLMSVTAI